MESVWRLNVIAGKRNSDIIGLNGPAAQKVEIGDEIFIISYAQIDPEVESSQPTVVHLNGSEE